MTSGFYYYIDHLSISNLPIKSVDLERLSAAIDFGIQKLKLCSAEGVVALSNSANSLISDKLRGNKLSSCLRNC